METGYVGVIRMSRFFFVLHVLYCANVALLLIGILLVRKFWTDISDVLIDMTRIRAPWMPTIFVITLLFLLLGLFLIVHDIKGIGQGRSFTDGVPASGALIANLSS